MRQVDHPDNIVRHSFRPGQTCPKCSHRICAGDDETRFEARQVFELPPITLEHCPLSQGTLANFVKRGGRKAGHAMPMIRAALGNTPVLHADETGCRLHGRRHWLHVASSGRLTCYHVNEVIGGKTRLRILEKYAAILEGGYKINPEPAPPPPDKNGRRRRGKVARGKALNLLDRLDQRYGEIMGFFENEGY